MEKIVYKKSKIENLPNSLHTLECYNKGIKIENLPNSLHTLICWNNKITKIENLPNSLHTLICWNNEITKIDNLEIARFNKGEFDLHIYNCFKRLQRRIRYRYNRKNKAILVIQKGCFNWLWKAVTKDKKLGINFRLGLYKINGKKVMYLEDVKEAII